MKLAVPTSGKGGLEDLVAEHFGRCPTYTFLDEKGKLLEIKENPGNHSGGKTLPPELIKRNCADVLLCKGLGPKALNLCRELGIQVYVCQAKTANEIFKMWKSNKLHKASFAEVCEEHKL